MIVSAVNPPDPPTRHIALAEERFPCLELGTGAPVLFLHGALGDWRTWRRQCATLSVHYRCIAYSQRYFGTEPWCSGGPRFGTATHASDLIAIIEALGAGPVSVVAWSYAGHAALTAVLRRPDLFSRALVFEPGVPSYVVDAEEMAAFSHDAQAMFAPVFGAATAGDLELAVRRLIDGSAGEEGYFERQSDERRTIERDNAHTMPLLLNQEAPPHIGADDLRSLRVPVSIAWGAGTRPLFRIPSRAAAGLIGSGRHRELAGVGHLWPDEDPDGFSALVAEWLGEAG